MHFLCHKFTVQKMFFGYLTWLMLVHLRYMMYLNRPIRRYQILSGLTLNGTQVLGGQGTTTISLQIALNILGRNVTLCPLFPTGLSQFIMKTWPIIEKSINVRSIGIASHFKIKITKANMNGILSQ